MQKRSSLIRYTGHQAPLQNRPSENEPSDPGYLYNLKDTVELFISLGMDTADMVIGVPTYGRGFQLVDETVNGERNTSTFLK